MSTTRLEKLRALSAAAPDDAFLRYGLALELRGLGRTDEAEGELRALIERAPDYVPAHHQLGLLLAEQGDEDGAREALSAGIAAAERTGDAREAREMRQALDDLS